MSNIIKVKQCLSTKQTSCDTPDCPVHPSDDVRVLQGYYGKTDSLGSLIGVFCIRLDSGVWIKTSVSRWGIDQKRLTSFMPRYYVKITKETFVEWYNLAEELIQKEVTATILQINKQT